MRERLLSQAGLCGGDSEVQWFWHLDPDLLCFCNRRKKFKLLSHKQVHIG